MHGCPPGLGRLLIPLALAALACASKHSSPEPTAGAAGASVGTGGAMQELALPCIAPMVAQNCAVAGCHDSITKEHGMDLSTGESTYEAWVNRNGLDHCMNQLKKRVIPGDSDNSYVMEKITGQLDCQGSMSQVMPPPPRVALSAADVAAIRTWISNGARRDCGTGGAGVGGSPNGSGGASTGGGASSTDAGTSGAAQGGSAAGGGSGGDGNGGGEIVDPWLCTPEHACFGLLCAGTTCSKMPWDCVSHSYDDDPTTLEHPCPEELATYCGCDGQTFTSQLTCPDRPFDHPGACDDGYNCDPLDSTCGSPPPTCAEGEIPSVVRDCYAACVPYASCRCEFDWECPAPYKCVADRRCGPAPLPDGGT